MAEGILGRLKPDPWVVPWLMQFDGTRSVASFCSRTGGECLPRGFRLTDFTDLVSIMLERGFLTPMRRARLEPLCGEFQDRHPLRVAAVVATCRR